MCLAGLCITCVGPLSVFAVMVTDDNRLWEQCLCVDAVRCQSPGLSTPVSSPSFMIYTNIYLVVSHVSETFVCAISSACADGTKTFDISFFLLVVILEIIFQNADMKCFQYWFVHEQVSASSGTVALFVCSFMYLQSCVCYLCLLLDFYL